MTQSFDGWLFLKDWWSTLTGFVAGGASIIAAYLYIAPAWRILRRCLYRTARYSYSQSFCEALRLAKYGIGRQNLYRAARLRIELELLHPHPQKPNRLDFKSNREYSKAIEIYKEALQEWHEKIRTQLGPLIQEASAKTPILPPVKTCFDILKAEEAIRSYFTILAADSSLRAYDQDKFLSEVTIKTGFVAPLFLLTGLLARFNEDWKPVIDDYSRTIKHRSPATGLEFREFRAFQFNCWILWGPSIPMCTCSQWYGNIVLQYGYGDENNSLALLHTYASSPEASLKDVLENQNGFRTLVAQTEVTGIIRYGPSVSQDFCPAQQAISSEGSGRLLLECSHPIRPKGGNSEQVGTTYYSAYLWIMFVTCDLSSQPLYDEQWMNLLPFFEHSNIAAEGTTRISKQLLVGKALSAIQQLLEKHPNLTLQYVCAYDDNGCDKPMRFPPQAGESLCEIFRDILEKNPAFAGLRESGRIVMPKEKTLLQENFYSACHLPEILSQYYTKIQETTS